MTADRPVAENLTANVELAGPNFHLRAAITVPAGPTRVRALLPMVQSLTDAVVDAATRHVQEQGQSISCKHGCAACCRQLVPVSETEARQVADLVESLPEPRRGQVRDRFVEAQRRLMAAGLLERLQRHNDWSHAESWPLGLEYLRERIACPFLEEESCSIYADRPTACREYLVTSPAENCSDSTLESIRCVPLPLKVSTALARCDTPTGGPPLHWIPLILAPQWAARHGDEPSPRTGPQFVEALVSQLTGKNLPVQPSPGVTRSQTEQFSP
jgi:Fe-S-cluster containining protein